MKPGLIGPVGQKYEGTWIQPWEAEVTMFIQHVFEELEAGNAAHLLPDPFYVRAEDRPPLTDADCDRLIEALDEEYDSEMGLHPGHHKDRSGAMARTEMHRLPPLTRRYLAEGLDRIIDKHRDIDQEEPPAPEPTPAPSAPGPVPEYTG